jgi:hypothetical protein
MNFPHFHVDKRRWYVAPAFGADTNNSQGYVGHHMQIVIISQLRPAGSCIGRGLRRRRLDDAWIEIDL